jgi:hypothetical protein
MQQVKLWFSEGLPKIYLESEGSSRLHMKMLLRYMLCYSFLKGPMLTSGKDQLLSTVNAILDYNTKSLADFDGIDITLDPCTKGHETACQDNMCSIEEVRKTTTDRSLWQWM